MPQKYKTDYIQHACSLKPPHTATFQDKAYLHIGLRTNYFVKLIIGIILLLSLLTIPTVVANTLTKDYRRIALIASVVGVIGNLAGFVLSYAYDLPTGSCIIFMLCITLISVKVLSLPSL